MALLTKGAKGLHFVHCMPFSIDTMPHNSVSNFLHIPTYVKLVIFSIHISYLVSY